MRLRLPLALAALLAASAPAAAQGVSADTPRRAVSPALAITGARVVVAPGTVRERATVVVRDGRIVSVGDGPVPFDARVLAGDSLTVYAGFVDAFGYAGIPKPDEPEAYEGDRDAPPRQLAGIVPDTDARALFDPTDAGVQALREAGFGAAHVVPREGLLSGEGSVVVLRALGRGEGAGSLVLAGPLSAVMRIDTAPGVYPATPMAVLATLRETVENARRARAARGDRRGFARLAADPALDALGPLLDGERRLFFVAESALDGFRVLRASDEMALAPVLVGVPDAAPLLGKLREAPVPVVAPLALPDTVKADSAARAVPLATTPSPGGVSFVSDRRTLSVEALDAERTALTVQRRAAVRRAEGNAAALAEAGVPLAFGTLGVKPADVLPNLRRMVAAGLAADAALGALTTGPAELLGLEGVLGTVEPGKLANLVVTTGDLFADSTALRYVVVEGALTEIDADAAPAGDPDAVVVATGTWDLTVSTPGGDQTGTFELTGDAGDLAGTVSIDGDTLPLDTVTLVGNSLTMTFAAPEVGDVTVTGIITDDTFEGTAELAFGTFPFTATRRPG